jgi:hypothetical protein
MPRASFLGSNPLSILVRCTCGYRSFFDRGEWQSRAFARCDNCGACIRYNSLEVIPFAEGGNCMEEKVASREEVEELRRLEELMREFKLLYDKFCSEARLRGKGFNPFAPQTIEMMEGAAPVLQRLDELRALKPAA